MPVNNESRTCLQVQILLKQQYQNDAVCCPKKKFMLALQMQLQCHKEYFAFPKHILLCIE